MSPLKQNAIFYIYSILIMTDHSIILSWWITQLIIKSAILINMIVSLHIKRYFSLTHNLSILGLKSTAKLDEVKKRYYELAKIHHPDINSHDVNANQKFMQITKVSTFL